MDACITQAFFPLFVRACMCVRACACMCACAHVCSCVYVIVCACMHVLLCKHNKERERERKDPLFSYFFPTEMHYSLPLPSADMTPGLACYSAQNSDVLNKLLTEHASEKVNGTNKEPFLFLSFSRAFQRMYMQKARAKNEKEFKNDLIFPALPFHDLP